MPINIHMNTGSFSHLHCCGLYLMLS